MKIRKTLSSALVLLAVCLITACSSGGDSPPATTTDQGQTATVVANAGPDQSVFLGTFVTLDGSKSTNANGTGLTYTWTLQKPVGSAAALSSTAAVNPTFTTDIGGTYEATLVVSNGLTSASDIVLILAAGTNPPPVANAGSNQNAFTGRTIILDGKGSTDPNGDPLKFVWSIAGKPAGSSPTLLDAATVSASFIPDVSGTYIIRLIVNDGTSDSTPASTTITAAAKPAPTANAGPNQFAVPNIALVTLDGNSSQTNPPGENLNFEWTINSSSFPVALNNANTAIATFTPPANTAGTVVAQLKVTEPNHPDSTKNTALDTVMVTIGPLAVSKVFKLSDLSTPILTCDVTACPSTTVVVNTPLRLDSTGSLVQPLTTLWSVTSPPSGWTLSSTSSSIPTFTPTVAATGGTAYTIKLTVTDVTGKTDSRSFTIVAKVGASAGFTWSPINPVPVTNVTLNPTITADPDLSYLWEFIPPLPTESGAVLSNNIARNPVFTADKAGAYTVKLTVTDAQTGATDTDTKTIKTNTQPTAKITLPSPINVCSTVKLSGTLSTDDGSVVSYSWTLAPPTGSLSALNDSASQTPTFKADKRSEYTVTLKVTDNLGLPSATVSSSFTPERNSTGQTIYDANGLPGMSGFGILGPKCRDCHAAGTYDPIPPPTISGAPDLSSTAFDIGRIKTRVTTDGHLGGKTTLKDSPTDDALTDAVTALRQFLDSTLANCP